MTSASRSALRLALAYLCLAGGWIVLSDRIAARIFTGPGQMERISQYKGLFFVGVTSLLLYLTLKRRLESFARSQEALSKSERRFAAFMANLPLAAFLRDAEGRYVYVNDYWRQRFGRGQDWQGATPLKFFDAETVAAMDEDHRKVLAGAPLVERNFTLSEDGRRTDWLVRRFPLSKGDGGILVGAFAIDLTEQKRLEEQLRQVAKMEALGLLAGGVAHDFNNLLTVINGYAQLLDAWSADPRAARRAAEQIRKAGDHAALLTGQLLAFGRKQMVQAEAIDLNGLIVGFMPVLAKMVGEHIRLQAVTQDAVELVWADRSQMEQVLLNLVVNARDAVGAGGGSIVVSTENTNLSEEAIASSLGLPCGRYVQLTVSDSGCGMDTATQARIFEPFFTTKERGKGTGLGLSTVYGIVSGAGGTVRVESRPGKGATFRIWLPATSRTVVDSAETALAGGSRVTILLVEDDEGVRGLTRLLLEKDGHRVVACVGGKEAIEAMGAINGDVRLVVTDVVMPEMSGPEVARRLREIDPSLKVLYISGYSEDRLVQAASDEGSALLRKPFTAEALGLAVRRVLEG